MTHCPICNQPITTYLETEAKKPFIHTVPFIGLEIWGSMLADKEVVCVNDQYVHIIFHHDGEQRLVKMGVEGSERHYYNQEEPEDPNPAYDDLFDDDDDFTWYDDDDF